MYRKIQRIIDAQAVTEGAGVKVNRVFAQDEVALTDPFLLLDDFRNKKAEDYQAGFPWHPHRGIETVTYMKLGQMRHEDSIGNNGVIGPGGVQWMTAGGGIIHQEMPEQQEGRMEGFQLWVNLPAEQKMTEPWYQEYNKEMMPVIDNAEGIIKVICGNYKGHASAIENFYVDARYLDICIKPGQQMVISIPDGYSAIAYAYDGCGIISSERELYNKQAAIFERSGDELTFKAAEHESFCLLLISGRPLEEKIAWQGPIVMNNREEIMQAFDDYRNGTFVKKKNN